MSLTITMLLKRKAEHGGYLGPICYSIIGIIAKLILLEKLSFLRSH